MGYKVILAHDLGYGIGKDNSLPWDLPEDLAFFKEKTVGKHLVCSSTTYESLPQIVKDRVWMVQSSRLGDKVQVANLTSNYLKACSGNTIVIGGSSLYNEDLLLNADEVFITQIRGVYDCDTYLDSELLNYMYDNVPNSILKETEDLTIRSFLPTYAVTKFDRGDFL